MDFFLYLCSVKAVLEHIVTRLTPFYPPQEARELAYWIIQETTGMSRFDVSLGRAAQPIPNLEIILQKLCQYVPVQYIFGHTEWFGLDLQVTKATLIPRPETAELVALASSQSPKISPRSSAFRVLDIGTGSGCIALALKQRHPEWQVLGVDISAEAVDVARANARRNNLEVDFVQADIFVNQSFPAFNMVISNPPYIRPSERCTMTENTLRYEPASALFVTEDDPLCFYRRIAQLHLAPELWFEISETQGEALVELMRKHGYQAQCLNDMCGKQRFIHAIANEANN